MLKERQEKVGTSQQVPPQPTSITDTPVDKEEGAPQSSISVCVHLLVLCWPLSALCLVLLSMKFIYLLYKNIAFSIKPVPTATQFRISHSILKQIFWQ